MTAIVGFVEKGKVWIGGDSAGCGSDWSRTVRRDAKVFALGDHFLIGFTTSFRMGQLIRFKFRPPEQGGKQDGFEYLCSTWVDSLRECLKAGGFAEIDKNREQGGCFLLGYRGSLYTIYSDFQVAESADGFAACGCGEPYALGALHVARGNARQRITTALEAAARFSAGVTGPFVIESI
jgi:ATP-dependent protease HslVU (ClpYQ) peptidase subunit